MSTKEITISKNSLLMGGGSSTKPKRSNSSRSQTPRNGKRQYTNLKRDILSKLKNMQSDEHNSQANHIEESNISQLEESINYINKLIERKKQKRKNKTLKRKITKSNISLDVPEPKPISHDISPQSQTLQEVTREPLELSKSSFELPVIEHTQTTTTSPPQIFNTQVLQSEVPNVPIMKNYKYVKEEPAYGILKGGSKPTYRQYHNKTLKLEKPNETIEHSQEKPLTTYQKYLRSREIPKKESRNLKRRFKHYKVKTFKKNYNLGKNNETRKIGVLVKDHKTQKSIRDHLIDLEKIPILEKKEELRKRNVLKLGSSAPDKLIHNLYRNMVLSGDIVNTSSDVLVHNFMTEKNF